MNEMKDPIEEGQKKSFLEDYELTKDKTKFSAEDLMPLYFQTYWANQRPLETVRKSLENSLVYVVFYKGKPIAMLRLITDYATFAYLCDVLVDEKHRGKGISKWMLAEAFDHPEIKNLRRICLMTQDAQGLYRQFGFENIEFPDRYMEILRA